MSAALEHDRATCVREHCGKCRPSGVAQPPKPVDHDVQRARKPQGRRELDLGRLVQKVGRRIEDEGQTASQLFYEWEQVKGIPVDSTRGGGTGGVSSDDRLADLREKRAASRLRSEWLQVRVQIEALCNRADWLMDQARAVSSSLESKHRTPAQVEADGWCGNCWARGGFLVPISLRPTGEPYYKGRCRGCGSWPEGDPPKEVVEARNNKGKDLKRRAS